VWLLRDLGCYRRDGENYERRCVYGKTISLGFALPSP
jgi:hypothetical protein